MKRALLALAIAGCSGNPNGFCPADNTTDPGPGCSVPVATITIDGDKADWAAIPVRDCPLCAAGDVAQIRSVHTADGRIAFLLDTLGRPVVDANHSYVISLGPLREPSYWIDVLLQPGATPSTALNSLPFTGLPVEFAYGEAGIEVAFPIAALPHNGGVVAYADLEVFQQDMWALQQARSALVTACWDPAAPMCQPL